MKLSILENTPSILRFRLDGVSYNFANALRRAAINSVKSFAIDTVTFYENSSAIFDEYIAHRIGLVPIVTPKGYDEKDEVLFSLEATGPGTVYSDELKSNEKNVKVANTKIPIIKLAENQHLKLDAKAIMQNSTRSSKFQPGIVTYRSLDEGKAFEFYIESYGQMPAHEIMTRALAAISEGLKDLNKELK